MSSFVVVANFLSVCSVTLKWIPAVKNLTVDGGSKLLHGINTGVRFISSATGGRKLTVKVMDAGVVCLGEPNGFPIALNKTAPWADPDVNGFGISSVLFNNLWGTNYGSQVGYKHDCSTIWQ